MPYRKLSLKPMSTSTLKALRIALPGLFLFEAVYKLLVLLVFSPLLSGIIQLMLVLGGRRLVFNEAILSFFLSPLGIIAGLLFLLLASLLVYFEFAVIILMAHAAGQGSKITIRQAMAQAVATMKSLKNPGYIGFVLYAMLILPFVNNGVASSIVPQLDIPRFVSGELYKSWWGIPLLLGVTLGGFLLVEALMLVFPSMVLRQENFFKACRYGHKLCHKNNLRSFGIVLLFSTLWSLVGVVPLVVQLVFLDFPYPVDYADVLLTFDFSLLGFLTLLLATLFWLIGLLLAPILLSTLTVMYGQLGGTDTLDETASSKVRGFFAKLLAPPARLARHVDAWLRPPNPNGKPLPFGRRNMYKIFLGMAALAVTAGLLVGMALYRPPVRDYVVIGHRGSTLGVENTVEALQGAIDAGADFAEIDILLSKDNIPMVIHDANLSRLAGRDLNVYDLTAEELSQITLLQNGHEGHISTLDEVIETVNGKMGLLIEFKQHGHETANVVDETLKVIQEKQFSNVLFHTLLYDHVLQMKDRYPSYKTGYTVFGSIGSVEAEALSELKADFIGIEEGMVSINFIRTSDDDHLPVFVWTPNEELDIEHYLELGASGIITDYPDIARPEVDNAKARQRAALAEQAAYPAGPIEEGEVKTDANA